jgi:hypothetical protein
MTAATYFTTRKAFRSEMGQFDGTLKIGSVGLHG